MNSIVNDNLVDMTKKINKMNLDLQVLIDNILINDGDILAILKKTEKGLIDISSHIFTCTDYLDICNQHGYTDDLKKEFIDFVGIEHNEE